MFMKSTVLAYLSATDSRIATRQLTTYYLGIKLINSNVWSTRFNILSIAVEPAWSDKKVEEHHPMQIIGVKEEVRPQWWLSEGLVCRRPVRVKGSLVLASVNAHLWPVHQFSVSCAFAQVWFLLGGSLALTKRARVCLLVPDLFACAHWLCVRVRASCECVRVLPIDHSSCGRNKAWQLHSQRIFLKEESKESREEQVPQLKQPCSSRWRDWNWSRLWSGRHSQHKLTICSPLGCTNATN